MTEKKWLACRDPAPMLRFLRKASERKLRLFSVACCRQVRHLLSRPEDINTLAVAEKFAEGLASELDLEKAAEAAFQASMAQGQNLTGGESPATNACWCVRWAATFQSLGNMAVAQYVHSHAATALVAAGESDSLPAVQAVHSSWLRCIFGPLPFRTATVAPAWRTATVVAVAQGIYDEHAFDRLPILADALEDAGCDNFDMLQHCRQPGDHVRGCWPVDLLLAKQ